ncbi:transcriptional regulator [Danxiaibacter flavus]|uniref:HTH-type transcriptional regulator n=1 Tax=Danxiaibacter flavus TaxID=3049108 RepID=A0ABV3ZM43_9BACT|nr:transcriptional regulator [Chitinophagaceae bacterium DXS]
MKLSEAKQQFIQSWGVLGSQWGINRSMAQVHAILLVASKPLSTDDIMEQLNISRGNANMNIRDLIDWGIVEKVIIPGDRKEYFSADKDIWRVATRIMYQRKKKELDPMLKVLNQISDVEGDKRNADIKAFTETVDSIKRLAGHADKAMEMMIKAEENWFLNSFMKLLK